MTTDTGAARKDNAEAAHIRPWMVTPRGWLRVLRRAAREIGDDRIGLTAAGIAFYVLLSIFPGLAGVVSLWSLFADPEKISDQIDQISAIAPPDVIDMLSGQAVSVASANETAVGATMVVSLLISFYSASRAMKAVMQALNIVFDEKESRNFFQFNAHAFAITLAVGVGFIGAVAAIVVVPIVLTLFGLEGALTPFVWFIRWPILFAGAWLAIAALYRFAPSRSEKSWKWLSPGAGAAVVLWVIASLLFSLYVQNFANYNETYGSLGAVVIVLMWFWVSAFVFLVGAEVDSEFEKIARERNSAELDLAALERAKARSARGS